MVGGQLCDTVHSVMSRYRGDGASPLAESLSLPQNEVWKCLFQQSEAADGATSQEGRQVSTLALVLTGSGALMVVVVNQREAPRLTLSCRRFHAWAAWDWMQPSSGAASVHRLRSAARCANVPFPGSGAAPGRPCRPLASPSRGRLLF